MRVRFRSILLTVAIVAAIAMPTSAQAAPPWAPVATATIHPGVMTYTDGAQCTSNFVFYDGSNNVYIGQAAHCAGTGGSTETNGCDSGSLPLGTKVEVDGASRLGTLVYSSWLTMQSNGESNTNVCQYNDFALVRLDPADYGKVNPSVPVWGGPVSVEATTGDGRRGLLLRELEPPTGHQPIEPEGRIQPR